MKVKLGFSLYLKLYKKGQLVERTHTLLFQQRQDTDRERKSNRRFSWEDEEASNRITKLTSKTELAQVDKQALQREVVQYHTDTVQLSCIPYGSARVRSYSWVVHSHRRVLGFSWDLPSDSAGYCIH